MTTNAMERLASEFGAQYLYACNGFATRGWAQQVQLRLPPWPCNSLEWHSHNGESWERHGSDLRAAMTRAFANRKES